MMGKSWFDLEPLVEEGEEEGSAGKSETVAIILWMLLELARLKLNDLTILFLEKISEEIVRMKYTKTWTSTNIATFTRASAKSNSINFFVIPLRSLKKYALRKGVLRLNMWIMHGERCYIGGRTKRGAKDGKSWLSTQKSWLRKRSFSL